MPLPDYFRSSSGTPIVWGQAGAVLMGLTVTKNMSLNGLVNGSGWNGVYADLGANWEQEYSVWVMAETGTAPVAGNVIEVYFSCSHTTTAFPGKATGTDAAYSATPSVATNKLLLGLPVCLVTTADLNTELIQNAQKWFPTSRYVAPVLINSLGQALRAEGTAANNTSGIIMVPTSSIVEE